MNRFCASSVQTTRMAFHAIKAGEGDVFVSAGVEMVSRYAAFKGAGRATRSGSTRSSTRHASSPPARRSTNTPWSDPREHGGLPDVYLAMGQTAENVAHFKGVSRQAQDEWGVESQNRAEKAQANGVFAREITPVTLPDGSGHGHRRLPSRRHHAGGRQRPQAGVPRDRHHHRRQRVPPQRRRRRPGRDERHEGAPTSASTPLARVVATGVSALSPEIMGLGPIEASRQALAPRRA